MLYTDGIYKSLNKGQAWTRISTAFVLTGPISIAINSKGHLFTSSLFGNGVYKSINDGADWALMTGTLFKDYAVNIITIDKNDNIFIGTRGKGIYASTNQGVNWTDINSNALWNSTGNTWIDGIILGPSNNLFVSVNGRGVFKSLNQGAAWTSLNTGLPFTSTFVTNPIAFAISTGGYLFGGTNDFGTYTTNNSVVTIQQPTITTASNVSAFTQTLETPSATQTYTISGSSLTNNILITPPANFEISNDAGVTWKNTARPITLSATSGSVASSIISIRLNAASTGSYAGDILNQSTGASDVLIHVTGVTTQPIVTGVTNIENIKSFFINPNLVDDQLIFRNPLACSIQSIRVKDILGNCIGVYSLSQSDLTFINVSMLASGIYFTQYRKDEKIIVERFIKK